MVSGQIGILAAIVIYLVAMVYVGFYFSKQGSGDSADDFYLGGRKLGPLVTAMSAEASDMSSWLLMGLPGVAYLSGIADAGWTAIGLGIGTYLNWLIVAQRLRRYSVVCNAITIPDFFSRRFHDQKNILMCISAIIILIFFIPYTASGFKAIGTLFSSLFGVDYHVAMIVGAIVIVGYTVMGGVMAVSTTDLIQSIVMTISLIVIVFYGIHMAGGCDEVVNNATSLAGYLSMTHLHDRASGNAAPYSLLTIVSTVAWGLGYFGQPHILVRFMAISDAKELKKSTNIAMVWVILSLLAAIFVGLIGHVYMLPEKLVGTDAETIFLVMTERLFTPFMAGPIWSAVLAAIMSTASAQLLVTASAIANDFYANIIHKTATDKELVLVSRIVVLLVAAISIFLALNPDSLILTMVAYAWAGFGAAFGPAIIFSLFWKRMTRRGCIAGIVVGGLTVLIWKQFAFFGLYEIVPGFIFSSIAIYIVSIFDKLPPRPVLKDYKEAEKLHIL